MKRWDSVAIKKYLFFFFYVQGIFKKNTATSFSEFCFGCRHIEQCFEVRSLRFEQGIYCQWREVSVLLRAQTAGLELQHLLQSLTSSLAQDFGTLKRCWLSVSSFFFHFALQLLGAHR